MDDGNAFERRLDQLQKDLSLVEVTNGGIVSLSTPTSSSTPGYYLKRADVLPLYGKAFSLPFFRPRAPCAKCRVIHNIDDKLPPILDEDMRWSRLGGAVSDFLPPSKLRGG